MNSHDLIGLPVMHKRCGEGVIIGFHRIASFPKRKYIKIQYQNDETRLYLISETGLPKDEFIDNTHIDEMFKQIYFRTKNGTVLEYDSIHDRYYKCNICGVNVLYSKQSQINSLKNGDNPPVLCTTCKKRIKKRERIEFENKEIRTLMKHPIPRKRPQPPHDTDGMHTEII